MLTMNKGLRDHLLAAQAASNPGPTGASTASPTTATHHEMHVPYSSPSHQIDPAIGGGSSGSSVPQYGMDHDMDLDGDASRKGRRELSTSKRAAQNRAAQRAFRQRKEQYIQSLKDQVKEHQTLAQNYETIQKENFQLRQYIITLQARLLESHTELPPPPESIDLSRGPPVLATSSSTAAPTAQMTSASIENQLQAAAAVAAVSDDDARRNLPYGGQQAQDSKSAEVPTDGSAGAPSRESSG